MNRARLEQLHPERFSSVLILADDAARVSSTVAAKASGPSIADADSRCLASLLLLRDIQSTRMPLSNKSRLACAPPVRIRAAAKRLQHLWLCRVYLGAANASCPGLECPSLLSSVLRDHRVGGTPGPDGASWQEPPCWR